MFVSTVVAVLLSASLTAEARASAPHVPGEQDTDACAMCHRSHSASAKVTRFDAFTGDRLGNALIVGTADEGGSTELCYVCHGVDGLGSVLEVQSSFVATSAHVQAPEASDYGPSPKDCSTCHDSHGVDRDGDGDPYPALLRLLSQDDPQDKVFSGDEYCATCHEDRPADRWDGLDVWDLTAHSLEMTAPASGTGIVCSNCHDPHGSDTPPLIVETAYPPAAPETVTVPANDRWLCYTCHAGGRSTYSGGLAYEDSAHGVTETTVVVQAEWASEETTRAVGECQVCHAPMGRSDGEGGVIDRLLERPGTDLCYGCHEADGVAVDLASLAFPDAESGTKELIVGLDPARFSLAGSGLLVYSQETTGAAPRSLVGPRRFDSAAGVSESAAGDIDGDGSVEIVTADRTANRLTVYESDEFKGMSGSVLSLGAGVRAEHLAVADVLIDGTGLPEIAVVTRASTSPYASRLYLYRWNAGALDYVLDIAVGNDASGLASGDVTASAAADLAITSNADDELRVICESQTVPGTLQLNGPYATRSGPRGPSIGDAWDGATTANEIVVANASETTGTITVFDGAGGALASYDATISPGATAWDTLVADVLPGVAGLETAVVFRSETGSGGINVYPQLVDGGLGARTSYSTGTRVASSRLTSGDIDSDGVVELVVGSDGVVASDPSSSTAPSMQVFHPDGSGVALDAPSTHWLGGTDLAGTVSGLFVLDVGPVGESRHPVSAAEGTHVSTETLTVARHVECNDCHNVHETTSTPTPAVAPAAYGEILGTWGVAITNAPVGFITYGERHGVVNEYELCLKCHSAWSELEGGRNIAEEVDTRLDSTHAVESASSNASVTAGSFVTATPAWSASSVLYCVDCHDNGDASEVPGPHTSENGPILAEPIWGVRPSATDMLCYRCHKRTVYFSGTDDGVSGTESLFYSGALGDSMLHSLHTNDAGVGYGLDCAACHVSHGSSEFHLIRTDVGYSHAADGGTCSNECHTTGTPSDTQTYARP